MNLKESLETIKASRIDRCKKHSLVDILMIVFFGLLCGYKSIESIHLYAELSINVLKKYLVLANGIPSADTILRVLAKIDTEQLGKVFIEYARSVFGNRIKDGDVVAFDGKTECGSEYSPLTENETKHKAIHMVSASTRQGQTSILNLMFCLSFDKKAKQFFLWKINKSKLTARANYNFHWRKNS